MDDTELPDAVVDIRVDVESESTEEEGLQENQVQDNRRSIGNQHVAVAGDERVSNSDDHGSSLLASINEALMALFEDYRRRANPISDKGGEPQSQGNVGDDLGADYGDLKKVSIESNIDT
ncbi:Zinc finger-like protein [Corchorus olitorius]|uniref:Zinc finger-like protein n=1 Tax=Corchorus olitorius TaxID=93759 RepID=A0A1R3JG16_9ROSI|nr:Zinc finger-like protein [Corchorus olitorius]